MTFDWDEKKRKANLQRHGLDFRDAERIFENETLLLIDDRFDYGEIRYVTFGMLRNIVVALVYTEQDESVRVISLRRATPNEEKEYFKGIRD
jgi:uncharacterized protein